MSFSDCSTETYDVAEAVEEALRNAPALRPDPLQWPVPYEQSRLLCTSLVLPLMRYPAALRVVMQQPGWMTMAPAALRFVLDHVEWGRPIHFVAPTHLPRDPMSDPAAGSSVSNISRQMDVETLFNVACDQ